jgi:hypothetical protein
MTLPEGETCNRINSFSASLQFFLRSNEHWKALQPEADWVGFFYLRPMNTSSLQELKKELKELSPKQLSELCLALAKYKKDNKEYLSYLLFQSHNKESFASQIKKETDDFFEELQSQKNLYYIRKSLRARLRFLNKYCRYINDKATTADMLIYFLQKIKEHRIPIHHSARLQNLFDAQVKKIKSVIATLHEDLQADYLRELDEVEI